MSFVTYYNELLKESQEETKTCTWSSISKLSSGNVEFIYFLILHDYLSHGGDDKLQPYGSKLQMGGRGVLFTVDKLPKRTQGILTAHLKHISM